jgi:hypothetical protein
MTAAPTALATPATPAGPVAPPAAPAAKWPPPAATPTPGAPAGSVAPAAPGGVQSIGQLGAGGVTIGNIWTPFAGYGTRGRHVSWLLDNLGHRANDLHQAVTERFQQRAVPGADMGWQQLTAQGLIVERRPFYFVRRGITTVALYIAQFGRDLYISQVTYVKSPFSNLRIIILALMILFQLFFMFGFTNAVAGTIDGGGMFGLPDVNSGGLVFLLCVVGPLALLNMLALTLGLIFSLYKYFTEKDFLAILRRRPNEFQQDDTVALEKAVEETVRQALDKIGIPINVMPPSAEATFGSRPRLI